MERRDFIKLLGIAGVNTAAYAACSAYMQEALAGSTIVEDMLTAPVHCAKGSLRDIEHVVILMQENRSFDHYFGTLRGVRGFGDPRPLKMRDGEPVWHQAQKDSAAQRIKPYRLPRGAMTDDEGAAGGVFLQDPSHDYADGLAAWNNGLMDKWIPNKDIVSMAHYVESDIPLYFKLAKAFTICDANFCSHNGATDTNRSYFWTGTSKGRSSNSFFSSRKGKPDWKTYPEQLEELGISWKFYQDGLTWRSDDPFAGNYGDNTLEYFTQYQDKTTSIYKKNQSVNSVLRTTANEPSQLEKDIVSGELPAISWIVAPEAFSEHPKFPPHFGEYYLLEILRALIANKEVWKKTALFITYDENGGFFDHVSPPVPLGEATSPGIRITAPGNPPDINSENALGKTTPLGMGVRVPLLVISPWSAGGRVCSEVFDHTSFIKFLDTWLETKGKKPRGAVFENVSAWRRAIAGDLTSVFDFNPQTPGEIETFVNKTEPVKIFTSEEKQQAKKRAVFKPGIADVEADPDIKKPVALKQDRTQCNLLPIAYEFQILIDLADANTLRMTCLNTGKLGVAYTVYGYNGVEGPWRYSVEGIKPGEVPIRFSDNFALAGRNHKIQLVVHGPNGYLAEFCSNFKEPTEQLLPEILSQKYVPDKYVPDGKVRFTFAWPKTANGKLKAVNAYTGEQAFVNVETGSADFNLKDGWYDVSFMDAVNNNSYLRRYAGHMENGKMSKTDPAIGLIYDEKRRVYITPIMAV